VQFWHTPIRPLRVRPSRLFALAVLGLVVTQSGLALMPAAPAEAAPPQPRATELRQPPSHQSGGWTQQLVSPFREGPFRAYGTPTPYIPGRS
jgi:hypothetical protein